MLRTLMIAGLGAALIATPAAAMSDADCAAAWKAADVNSDGMLIDAEAARYLAALRVADKPASDGKLTNAAFLQHCKAGHFNLATTEPGAPLTGANSFTETQAKDRVMAAGYTNVSAFTKDANGVWRGTGMDGATSMKVAVDFKGNVVVN